MAAEGSGTSNEETLFAVGLLTLCGLGLVLRALHLDIPLRYDETITYTAYASQGWEVATTAYDTPNNHVLHSLLVGWLTGWLGSAPVVIRLPAFLAGCMLIPVTAWIAFQAHGRAAGLVAAALVTTSPILIEFSTNARGYTLLALCVLLAVGIGQRLLAKSNWILWVALAEVGVLGFYTLPLMIVPWAGVTLWLAAGIATGGDEAGDRRRRLLALLGTNVAVVLVTVGLYLGILANEGLDGLTGNRFVQAQPMVEFLAGAPAAAWAVLTHWGRGVPWPLSAVAAALIGAALVLPWNPRRISLPAALVAATLVVMLLKRNHGEPRIWLWVVPFLAIAAGIGVVEVTRRVRAVGVPQIAVAFSALWTVALTAQLFWAQPVRASVETGAYPEVETVVVGMAEHFRSGDEVLSDFVSIAPVLYYVERYRLGEGTGDPSMERTWIVHNRREPDHTRRLERRVERRGFPPLEVSTPVFSVGMTDVYLFGRPAGAPDPRLLEAIDWYTGVAGRVDDARARALLLEVVEDTGSALSRMWLARCHSRGRMLFEEDPELARSLAAEVIDEIRELASVGEPEAVFLMGTAYAEGLGVEVDPAEAVLWYRAAAEGGHVLSLHNLGNVYSEGIGVEADPVVAVHWWSLAAEQGDAVAQLRLGESYEAGRGVERSLPQAVTWYTQSAERGNQAARAALDRLAG